MTKAKLPVSISCLTIIGMLTILFSSAPAFADCGFTYENDVATGCPLEFWFKDSDGNLTIYDQDAAGPVLGYVASPKWRRDNNCHRNYTTNQCRVCIGLDPLPKLQDAADKSLKHLRSEAAYYRKHPDRCKNEIDSSRSDSN